MEMKNVGIQKRYPCLFLLLLFCCLGAFAQKGPTVKGIIKLRSGSVLRGHEIKRGEGYPQHLDAHHPGR